MELSERIQNAVQGGVVNISVLVEWQRDASRLEDACLGALRYLTGTATRFSERNKAAVGDKLTKALGINTCPVRGNDADSIRLDLIISLLIQTMERLDIERLKKPNRACPLCGNDASTGLPCGSINHPTIPLYFQEEE